MFWATQCTRASAFSSSVPLATPASLRISSTLAWIAGVTWNWSRFTSKNQRLLASQLSTVAITALGTRSLASGWLGSCTRAGMSLHHQA